MKCDTLQALSGEPLPSRCPVREVPPREESCPATGGGLQPEASCSAMQRSSSNLPCGQTMKLLSLIVRASLLASAVILSSSFFAPRASAQSNAQATNQSSFVQTPAVPARITQAIDETQLVRLKGNVHPLARPEFDQGVVPDSTPMNRMLMVLQRSPEQQAALSKLMDGQLSKDSPNYHKWLTPQQFGAQFGPADSDIQAVTDWLARQGFQGIRVA